MHGKIIPTKPRKNGRGIQNFLAEKLTNNKHTLNEPHPRELYTSLGSKGDDGSSHLSAQRQLTQQDTKRII